MAPTPAPVPSWVKELKPSPPHGIELIKAERAKSQLNSTKIAHFLHTKEGLKKRDEILETLSNDPVFDKSQNYFSGRIDRFESSLAKGKRLHQISAEKGWTMEDNHLANDLLSESTPYRLHDSMFIVTLRDQGTPQQHDLFLHKAQKNEIIGCYAQTELGHGSNVRGLETLAIWDPNTKEFVLHSPYITAAKWWIGSLGRLANYAVVMAQLIINKKPYGPHPFVVQIRDMKTHQPLDNICIGDIGPKFGFNTMDNGYLLFNKVRIPHHSMLAKFSSVDPQTSAYNRPASPSLVYGTLVFVRSNIVREAGATLARGVTIATRYCAVRRQFKDRDSADTKGPETQVLDYKMVQIRLLTLLAATFALHFTGKGMMQLYEANQAKMSQTPSKAKPDEGAGRGAGPEETHSGSDLLADLHATSCGLKSLASSIAAEGLEVCRRACGGHGYSSFSGIGPYYADYLPTTTWEGDNYMLTQQVARYLLKSARSVLKNEPVHNDTTRVLRHFLERQDMGAAFDILHESLEEGGAALVEAFAWRTAYLTFEALKRRDEQKMPWNELLVEFYRLSKAHSQYLIIKSFHETLTSYETRQQLGTSGLGVMTDLFRLFALHTLESEASEFFTSSALTVRQIQLARTQHVPNLLARIRPHAVRLVDSWDFPDWQLDSSLGRYDGKVYEDMFERASEQNPLNGVTVDPYPASSVLFKEDLSGDFKKRARL